MNPKPADPRRSPGLSARAFTMVELLVVVALVGLVGALALTGVSRSLTRAREAQCASQIKQITMGVFAYAGEHRGWMPPMGGTNTLTGHLSGYVGTAAVSRASVWRCAADTRSGVESSYGVNRLDLTPAEALQGWPLARVAHPARTVMLGDSGGGSSAVWELVYQPASSVKEGGVAFRHPFGRIPRANFSFYDGHVESFAPNALTVTNWHGLP